ncbi:MAG: FixH family protein [Burkholderiales bacterium]
MHAGNSLLDPNVDAKPWYAQIWPWLLMLGPFIVVIAATYTGWIAFSKQDALVVDDYYKQGNAINQDLRRDRTATNMGLSFNARYDAAAGKLNGRLLGFGTPVAGKLLIHFIHQTQPEKDLHLEAQVDQLGNFSVELPMLEMGRWQLSVEGAKRDWRLNGIWKWPQQQMVNLKADIPPAD